MLLAALAFGLITTAESCTEATEEEEAEVESGEGKSKDADSAKVGDKLTLKDTTYQVTDVKTSRSVGDNEFTQERADGQFVVVTLRLTNRKDEPATISDQAIKLIGGNDKTYTTDTDAIIAVDDQFPIFEEIQPDVTEEGKLIYDVPPGAVRGATLQVEDLFSDSKGTIRLGLR
jgi:hypothetical protein